MQSPTAKWFFEMAGIPSAALVFDDDLATELETYAKANVELLSRVVNVALASGVTFSESGLLYTLVGVVPRLVETLVLVDFAWMGFQYRKSVALIFLAAISPENFPSNVRTHIMHAIPRA